MNTTTLASTTRLNPVSRTLPVLLAMEDDAETSAAWRRTTA